MDATKENALREQGADTYANTAQFYQKKRAEAAIVWFAIRGLLPRSVAEYAIKRGGLRHE
jgi:hypothetical protein